VIEPRARRMLAVVSLLAASLGLGASHARADDDKATTEKANKLFDDGMRLVKQGSYGEACPKLEEARKLANGLGVTLYLADCFENIGRTASAQSLFIQAEHLAHEKKDAREKVARDRAARLAPLVPTLTIRLPATAATPAPEEETAGLEVTDNDTPVPKESWGKARSVDPGAHVVRASAPHKKPWSVEVKLDKGSESVDVPALEDDAAPAPIASAPPVAEEPKPPVAPPAHAESRSPQKLLGLGAAGVGVVSLGLGAYFGLHAKSKLDESTSDGHCADQKCDPTGIDLHDQAQSSAVVSTIAFAVGVVAVAGGAVLYFTAPKEERKASAAGAPARSISIAPAFSPGSGSPGSGAAGSGAAGGVVMRGAF
jgi:hypothetical protein